jgi:hypothetical protein
MILVAAKQSISDHSIVFIMEFEFCSFFLI